MAEAPVRGDHGPGESAGPASEKPADSGDGAGGSFDCNICLDGAQEPVITLCGHLYCWRCIYRWLEVQQTCPVCKSQVDRDKLIPIYGRGKERVDPRTRTPQPDADDIPARPPGQRTEPPPNPARNHGAPFPQFGPFGPMFHGGIGNVQFAAGIGFPGLFGFQMAAGPLFGGDGRDLTPEQANHAFISRLLTLVGILILLAVMML